MHCWFLPILSIDYFPYYHSIYLPLLTNPPCKSDEETGVSPVAAEHPVPLLFNCSSFTCPFLVKTGLGENHRISWWIPWVPNMLPTSSQTWRSLFPATRVTPLLSLLLLRRRSLKPPDSSSSTKTNGTIAMLLINIFSFGNNMHND